MENELKWSIPEYPQYQRGWIWYLIAVIAAAALLAFAVITGNFMFTVIIILGVLLSIFSTSRAPEIIELQLYKEGVKFGGLYYPWEKFRSFWVVDEGGEINLGLDLKNWLRADIYVPVKGHSLEEVEKFLLRFIPKNPDRTEEPLSYFLGKKLKI